MHLAHPWLRCKAWMQGPGNGRACSVVCSFMSRARASRAGHPPAQHTRTPLARALLQSPAAAASGAAVLRCRSCRLPRRTSLGAPKTTSGLHEMEQRCHRLVSKLHNPRVDGSSRVRWYGESCSAWVRLATSKVLTCVPTAAAMEQPNAEVQGMRQRSLACASAASNPEPSSTCDSNIRTN